MTRARRELFLTSARDYGGTRERKVSQFVLEALDLPKDARPPVQGPGGRGDRAVRAAARAGDAARCRRSPTPRSSDQPQAGRRLPDLPAEVPLRPRAARADPAPPHGRVRQHHPQGRRVLPASAGSRGTTPRCEDLLAEYDRKWLNQGLPHLGARGGAQGGRPRGAHALLAPGGGGGHQADLGREGLRLRARHQPRARTLRPRGRGSAGRGDRRLQDERGHAPEGRRPPRRREPPAQDVRAGLARDDGRLPQRVELRFIETPRGRPPRRRPRRTSTRRSTPSKAAAAGIRARRFDATPSRQAPAATARTTRSARSPPRGSERCGRRPM